MSVKYAVINASASGDNTVIAAVPGKILRLLGYSASAAGAVTATWKSGSTAISGPMTLSTGSIEFGVFGGGTYMAEYGIMQTAIGQALILNLGGAVQVGGHLVYREVQV